MIVVTNKKRFSLFIIFAVALVVLLSLGIAKITKKNMYPTSYSGIVRLCADKYSLDEHLIYAVIKTESNFKKDAISHKDAKGLMQVTDDTAKWCVEKFSLNVYHGDLFDAKTNITIGSAYLGYLLDHFGGDVTCALAAYNAGQGNVSKWLSDKKYSPDGKTLKKIPYEETREYVNKVLKRQEIYIDMYNK